jgi:hypothetical protein
MNQLFPLSHRHLLLVTIVVLLANKVIFLNTKHFWPCNMQCVVVQRRNNGEFISLYTLYTLCVAS